MAIRDRRTHRTVKEAQEYFDRLLAPVVRAERARGVVIPCREGCSWCCDEPLYAPRQEAALAADLVRAMPEEDRLRIEAATRDYVTRLMASPLAAEYEPNATAFRKLHLTCPLLKDRRCSIYADRPMGCRAHIARDTAAGCEDIALRPEQRFMYVVPQTSPALSKLAREAGGMETDHFVVQLHRELFGEAPSTGSAIRLEVREK